MIDQRLAELDRLAVGDQDVRHPPALGAGIWFMVFMASMIRSVWPWVTRAPTSTNGGAPGSGADRRCRPSASSRSPGAWPGRRRPRRLRPAAGGRGRLQARPPARRHGGGAAHELARHAHAHAVALDLDLGQAGLGEELGKLADQLLVDAGLALVVLRHRLASVPSCTGFGRMRSHDLSRSRAAPPAFWPAGPPWPRWRARSPWAPKPQITPCAAGVT